MPGQLYKLSGAVTDTRYVSAPVIQGQLVMADSAATDASGRAKVKPATAGATTVVGVARLSATNAAQDDTVAVKARNATTVIRKGQVYVTFAAAANEGAVLYAAANGAVTPTPTSPTYNMVVGRAAQKVASAGEGLAFIDV